GPRCGLVLSGNLADQIAFETCSWLENDSRTNDQRRENLAGLLLWFVAAATLGGVLAWRTCRTSRAGWLLPGMFGLLVLFLLGRLPLAHAYATWGLKYPRVIQVTTIKTGGASDLATAIDANQCCAYDVSAGAAATALFVIGSGCPAPTHQGSLINLGDHAFATVTTEPEMVLEACGAEDG
ncbi:MAG: hypothetical protein GY831_23515, partial [Delftia sp.]|nr:hypothetical protein [Delftia sp.]